MFSGFLVLFNYPTFKNPNQLFIYSDVKYDQNNKNR